MTTTFMNLTLPEVSVTLGPLWATEVNAALTTVDSHDHTVGLGNQVPTAGLAIDAALPFNGFGITTLKSASYNSNAALLTDLNTLYFKDGELYSNDGAGNQVRITAGGALDVGSVGGIGGDYGATAATAFYTDASLTYFFQDSTSSPAKLNIGALDCSSIIATASLSVGTTLTVTGASTLNSTLNVTGLSTLPTVDIDGGNIDGTTIATCALAATNTGYGLVKPGMMIAVASNLTGSHAIPATGVVDSSGYMVCDGAAIPGGQTVSGSTPNLSDSRFLMGSTSSGSTGGSSTINLSHSHTVNNHTHTITSHAHSAGSYFAKIGYDGIGQTVMTSRGVSPFTATRKWGGSFGPATGSYTANGGGATVDGTSGGSTSTPASGGSTPGTNSQLSSSQSIVPKYVTCQYLIRVK